MPPPERGPVSFRVVVSALAADRLRAACDVLLRAEPWARVLVVAPTRGAADDLVRLAARERPATFGVERATPTQLAARIARVALAGQGRLPGTAAGAEAVAARSVFGARREGTLPYFGPVSGSPGFPRALARTIQELRLAGVEAGPLRALPLAGADLADLLARFDAGHADADTVDRAMLLRVAADRLRIEPAADVVVLLDPVLDLAAERELLAALAGGAREVLATMPDHDRAGVDALAAMGGALEVRDDAAASDLGCLRRYLFSAEAPGARASDGSLEVFSAPGEGREVVEIVRRVVAHAREGIPFDEMAILIRSPQGYVGLLEHALARARVPAWFERGTRRPHPSGRAFLALLACAGEHLSAARFAEYLSLGQVPSGETPRPGVWAPPGDESVAAAAGVPAAGDGGGPEDDAPDVVDPGTLRAPWKWEQLLVESAVIGENADRWRRRLEGQVLELRRRIAEADRADGGDAAKVRGLTLVHDQLEALRAFALPIVEALAAWPAQATWGEWLDRFETLLPAVLRFPYGVARVLADLRPMADVGPVDLGEVRRVLAERLLTHAAEPPARRFGRVFVGTPGHARGRTFQVVFVPGLAERLFPQKPREDALLLDELRHRLDRSLATQHERLSHERLQLRIAVGAATHRLHVSYPRIELNESRARVPSFYALDLVRATTGAVPDHEALEERARVAGDALLAWPAPSEPEMAIDDQEHDLAVLRRLLDEPQRSRVRGHGHYLLKLNDHLRRSVVDRWARGEMRWSAHDGLTRVTRQTAAALEAERLTRRAYSLSALQQFSACPYQFTLSAVFRLRPLEAPQPLQRMDPLTRGSLVHEIQARFFRTLEDAGALPVTSATITAARPVLDATIAAVATEARDALAPAVARVWADEIAAIRRDLHTWLEYVARDGTEWRPAYFEYAFGAVPGERDPRSRAREVVLEPGFRLRGAIDLIEEHRATGVLRVTDHKTGRAPDGIEKVVVGGGAVLQPVLYPMVVEAALGKTVSHGRLFYCTSQGAFAEHGIPLVERTRGAALEVLTIIDRAIEHGFLAAAPTGEACGRCDFRVVCGPDVARRVGRKPADPLADLDALRRQP